MKKHSLMTLLAFLTASALSAKGIIANKPYLQNPTGGGITVSWTTNVPTYSWVEYGASPDSLKRVATMVDGQIIAGNTIHAIRINDIAEGRKYYYRVCSKEMTLYKAYKKEFGETEMSDLYEFSLAPTSSNNVCVLVFNDLHKQNQTLDDLMKAVGATKYDFVVFNGDCIDDPNNRQEAVTFLKSATESVKGMSHPMIFIRGNHEIRGHYSIALREVIEYSTEKSYGGFSWGGIRFIILDCGEDKPDNHPVYYGLNDFSQFRKEQLSFLQREFKSKEYKRADKRVLIHHIPLYSQEMKKEYNPCYDLWHPTLSKAKIDVSLNAHTHQFEYLRQGSEYGNTFPVLIGGGPKQNKATVTIINKVGKKMTVRTLNTKGEELVNLDL